MGIDLKGPFNAVADAPPSTWADIKSGSEATLAFGGKIVAYKTNIDNIGNQDKHWQLPGRQAVFYGYVDGPVKEEPRVRMLPPVLTLDSDSNKAQPMLAAVEHSLSKDLNMACVLKAEGSANLLTKVIARGQAADGEPLFFRMREATDGEVAAIRRAVTSSQAKIEGAHPAFFLALSRSRPGTGNGPGF